MLLLLTNTSRPPMRTLIPVTGGEPPLSSLTIKSSSRPSSTPSGLSTGLRRTCVTMSLRFSRPCAGFVVAPFSGGLPSTCWFLSLIEFHYPAEISLGRPLPEYVEDPLLLFQQLQLAHVHGVKRREGFVIGLSSSVLARGDHVLADQDDRQQHQLEGGLGDPGDAGDRVAMQKGHHRVRKRDQRQQCEDVRRPHRPHARRDEHRQPAVELSQHAGAVHIGMSLAALDEPRDVLSRPRLSAIRFASVRRLLDFRFFRHLPLLLSF